MSRRILVVDDNPVNLKLAVDVLLAAGFLVDTAIDAEKAVCLITNRLPDLILMDIELPGMDGLTLTRQLKANARTSHIPVMALTAFAMKGDEQTAIDAGCDGYITKPIDTRMLPRQISDVLSKQIVKFEITGSSPQ